MAKIDYTLASLEQREKFSFTKLALEDIYRQLKTYQNITGSVIISTCNRTEIYLSAQNTDGLNPFQILCQTAGIDFAINQNIYDTLEGEEVVWHLCELASGVKSQIWGDGQIISQIKSAIDLARDNEACNATLEVLFRKAITGGKKVRSQVKYATLDDSTAKKAVEKVNELGSNKNVLVIGNGEIGRLVASLLITNNHQATMTLRQYTNGNNIIPDGVKTVEYTKRYEILNQFDAVISATLSPHFTIDVNNIVCPKDQLPYLFVDLAVPRDIDPKAIEKYNLICYNVDDISSNKVIENKNTQLEEIQSIIKKYVIEFNNWCKYKEGMLA